MNVKITMLGCGSSQGVPEIGCQCEVCRSKHPKNKRTRVSVLVETKGKKLLIDTSPDLRAQALSCGLTHIDAVIFTHGHADHVHGIDDLRQFNMLTNDSIPVYADPVTLSILMQRFAYAFQPKPQHAWYRPSIVAREIPSNPPRVFDVEGIAVTPFWQQHSEEMQSLGFRIGNFAYSTDVNGFPDESFAALEGLDVWVVDCLRYTKSYTHSRVEMTLQWIDKVKPKLAVLTHMAHQLDYEALSRELPTGVMTGYDGMILEST